MVKFPPVATLIVPTFKTPVEPTVTTAEAPKVIEATVTSEEIVIGAATLTVTAVHASGTILSAQLLAVLKFEVVPTQTPAGHTLEIFKVYAVVCGVAQVEITK